MTLATPAAGVHVQRRHVGHRCCGPRRRHRGRTRLGAALVEQRVVILGVGTAGIGIADLIRDAMVREGLSHAQATVGVVIVVGLTVFCVTGGLMTLVINRRPVDMC